MVKKKSKLVARSRRKARRCKYLKERQKGKNKTEKAVNTASEDELGLHSNEKNNMYPGSETVDEGENIRIVPPDKKLLVTKLNEFITCYLCAGYFVNPVTITECLHTFCRSCIVRYFMYHLSCPICKIQVHPTNPMANVRYDRQIQDIVAKLLPAIYEDEDKREKEFYHSRGMEVPEKVQYPIVSDEPSPKKVTKPIRKNALVSLMLEYHCENGIEESDLQPLVKKFVRVSGMATIAHVQNFLKKKLLLDSMTTVNIFCDSSRVEKHLTLQNVQNQFYDDDPEEDPIIYLHYDVESAAVQ